MKKLIQAKQMIVMMSILICMIASLVAMISYIYTDKLYPVLLLFIIIISVIVFQKNGKGDSIDFFNS